MFVDMESRNEQRERAGKRGGFPPRPGRGIHHRYAMTMPCSDRLTYAPLCEADWPFFLSLQTDPQVMRYVSDARDEATIRAAFDVRLPRWEVGSPHWLCLVMREKSSQTEVGVTGLVRRGDGIAEVGFLLASAYFRRGYGLESLRALCHFAFSVQGFRKLTAVATAGNAASRAVLERAGFRLEETLRESYFLHGRWQDDWMFGLVPTGN